MPLDRAEVEVVDAHDAAPLDIDDLFVEEAAAQDQLAVALGKRAEVEGGRVQGDAVGAHLRGPSPRG